MARAADPHPLNAAADAASRIVAGQRIVGEVQGDGDLRVDGQIDGSIRIGGALSVGPGAQVRADVLAGRVRVEGLLEGRVRAAQSVVVAATGRLIGEVHGVLVVDEGGVFRGRLRGELGEVGGNTPNAGDSTLRIGPIEPVEDPPDAPVFTPQHVRRVSAPEAQPALRVELEGSEPPSRQTAPAAPVPLRPPRLLRPSEGQRIVQAPPPQAPSTGRMAAVGSTPGRRATIRLDENSDPRPRATTQPSGRPTRSGSAPVDADRGAAAEVGNAGAASPRPKDASEKAASPSGGAASTAAARPGTQLGAQGNVSAAKAPPPAPTASAPRSPPGARPTSRPVGARPTSRPVGARPNDRELDDPWFDAEPEDTPR